MAEVETPPRQLNRAERRKQASQNRKANKALAKKIEASARRRFEKIRKMQTANAEEAATDYAFG
jgi:hypothetical protein